MGYIPVDQGVVTHRKTLHLDRLLSEDRYIGAGRLVARWTRCVDSAIAGSLADIETQSRRNRSLKEWRI